MTRRRPAGANGTSAQATPPEEHPGRAKFFSLQEVVDDPHVGDIQWVLPRLLPEECVVFVAGMPKKARKTWLMMHVAQCVAGALPFCGVESFRPRCRRPVIYAFMEGGYARAVRRWRKLGITPSFQGDIAFSVDDLGFSYVRDSVLPKMRANGVRGLLLVDPFVRLERFLNVEDENDSMAVVAALAHVQDVMQSSGWTAIIAHHYRKNDARMRGSTAIEGEVDGWWDVSEAAPGVVEIDVTLRDGEDEPHFAVRIEGERNVGGQSRVVFSEVPLEMLPRKRKPSGLNGTGDNASAVDAQEIAAAVLDVLDRVPGGELSVRALGKALRDSGRSCAQAALQEVIHQLVSDGVLARTGLGRAAAVRRSGAVLLPFPSPSGANS